MMTHHVKGDKKRNVMLYALSTCVWCKKTKMLLEELNIDFDLIEVDLLSQTEKTDAVEEVKKWNPECSFPSLVIDNKMCIAGYNEEKLRNIFK